MNWTVNFWDLVLLLLGGVVLYARLVAVETKLDPVWKWWSRAHSLKPTQRRDDD